MRTFVSECLQRLMLQIWKTQILIIEMGMNHPGEISKLSKCLCPDKALITNIGTAHIGNLGSRENIARAKMEITDGMNGGILLVPDDEPLLKDVKNKIVFSFTDINADYFMKTCPGEKLSFYKNGVLFSEAMFSVIGEHNKKCLLAAVSLAIELGLSSEEVSYGISLISGDNTRQKTFCKENLYFFTDFYNASRESVLAFIKSAEEATTNFSKSLFLGDILELGNMSDEIHFEIGKAISPEVFSSLFLFGKSISETYRGAVENGFPPDRIFINQNISNPLLSAMQIRKNCSPNDMIFMKASRGLRLERILDCFS